MQTPDEALQLLRKSAGDGKPFQAVLIDASARELEDRTEPAERDRRLALLDAASRVAPEDAQIHLVAGQAYLDAYHAGLADLERRGADPAARTGSEQ